MFGGDVRKGKIALTFECKPEPFVKRGHGFAARARVRFETGLRFVGALFCCLFQNTSIARVLRRGQ